MADNYWLRNHTGEVSGPYSGAALKQMAKDAKLDPSCQISTDKVHWTTAAKVRNLFAGVESALAANIGVGKQTRSLTPKEAFGRWFDEFVLNNDNFKDTIWFLGLVPQLRVWWAKLTRPAGGFVIKEVTAAGVRNVKYDLGTGEAKEISEGEAERKFSDGVRQARLFDKGYRALLVLLGVGWAVWLLYDFVTNFSPTFGTIKTVLCAAVAFGGFIYKTRRARVFVGYHLDAAASRRLQQIAEAVSALKGCGRVWMFRRQRDEGGQGWKYNAGESHRVHRLPVAFFARAIPNVRTNIRVNGIAFTDMAVYFLPEKLLLMQGGRVAYVPYDALRVGTGSLEFPDAEGPIYGDTPVVGRRWKNINRDGSPDRRFKDNVELPVVRCGILKLAVGQTRLDLMTTNPNAPGAFAERLSRLARLPGVSPSHGGSVPSVAVEATPGLIEAPAFDPPAFDPPEPSRPLPRPVRNAAPSPVPRRVPRLVWLLGGVAALFLVCCGGPLTIGWYGSHAAASALAEADKEYAAGKREEAVAKYVANYDYSPEKEKILKRIVEYKAESGDAAGAVRWVGTGLDSHFNIVYEGPAAQALLAQVQQDRANKEAQKKAEEAAADARRQEQEAQRKADAEAKAKAQAAQELQAQVDGLQSHDWQTCGDAADALGRMGAKARDAVPALIAAFGRTALRDGEEVPIGGRCIAAVEKIGPAALPAVTDALRNSDNPGLRSALVDVLKQWGPGAKDAAPVLAGLTAEPPGDDDDPLCYYAASALSSVDPDDPRLVPALVQALGHNSLTRATALDDLAAIGPRAKPALPTLKRVADGTLRLKHPPKSQGTPGTPAGPLQGGSEEGSLRKSQMRAAELMRSLSG